MKRFSNLMPMQLQFFAEDNPNGGSPSAPVLDNPNDDKPLDSENDSGSGNDEDDENNDKNANIIEKLKGRIGKEQSKKNELQAQLEKVQQELENLRKGKKPKADPVTPEKQEIEALKSQINRLNTIDETVTVFQENGVDMPKDIVEVLVTDDHDQTIDNASKLLEFVTNIRKATESAVRKEYSGGRIPQDTSHGKETPESFGAELGKLTSKRASLDSFK